MPLCQDMTQLLVVHVGNAVLPKYLKRELRMTLRRNPQFNVGHGVAPAGATEPLCL